MDEHSVFSALPFAHGSGTRASGVVGCPQWMNAQQDGTQEKRECAHVDSLREPLEFGSEPFRPLWVADAPGPISTISGTMQFDARDAFVFESPFDLRTANLKARNYRRDCFWMSVRVALVQTTRM